MTRRTFMKLLNITCMRPTIMGLPCSNDKIHEIAALDEDMLHTWKAIKDEVLEAMLIPHPIHQAIKDRVRTAREALLKDAERTMKNDLQRHRPS